MIVPADITGNINAE